MADRAQNLQDTFLNHVRKNKTPLTIFLVNGVKLQGIVTWFDNFCVLLRRDGHSQLVYKHAISTIMPGAPLQLFEPPTMARAPGSPIERQFDDQRTRTDAADSRSDRGAGAGACSDPSDAWQRTRRRRRRRRSARVEEAVGLARAIDLDVVEGSPCRSPAIRPATLFGTGKVEEIASARRCGRGRAGRRRSCALAGAAAQSREGLEGQGHRPHGSDPRDIRRAGADAGRARCRSNSRISPTRRAGSFAAGPTWSASAAASASSAAPAKRRSRRTGGSSPSASSRIERELGGGRERAAPAAREPQAVGQRRRWRWSATPMPESRRSSTR